MELQLQSKAVIPRFHQVTIADTIAAGKDPIIDPAIGPDRALNDNHAGECPRPRAAHWLWHPWYAKLCWAGIFVWWAGKAGSFYSPALDDFYTSTPADFLNILFFPPHALMVLGLGFARAWLDAIDWEFIEPTQEQIFPKRSVGGMRDPAADPLDPRSGTLHWRRVDGSP